MPGVHGGIEFSLTGSKELRDALRNVATQFPSVAMDALKAEAEIELAASQEIVPVLTGALKRSGRVEVGDTSAGDLSVKIKFGNPDVPYAIIQHEKLQYEHDDGEAKYLESTLRASRVFLVQRLARRLESEIRFLAG